MPRLRIFFKSEAMSQLAQQESIKQTISSKRFPNNLPEGWKAELKAEADKDYFKKLSAFLKSEYKTHKEIFPAQDKILRAFRFTDFNDVKVVILGQDPYHGPHQALGLSFAVPNDLRLKPPSLQNIFKEIKADLDISWDGKSSELTGWAKQGVFLLNSVLTVRKNQAFSHQKKGWETFTDTVIEKLNQRKKGIVFLLWGAAAQKKSLLITNPQHFILKCAHPSPLSSHRGFFGCKHFSKTNDILKSKLESKPIDWSMINED